MHIVSAGAAPARRRRAQVLPGPQSYAKRTTNKTRKEQKKHKLRKPLFSPFEGFSPFRLP